MDKVKSELYRENRKLKKRLARRRKVTGLDKYLIFSFVSIIIFTVAQSTITAITGVEQSTLTTCFFGVFGGEVLSCVLIKRLKLKNENRDESEETDDE